MPLFDYVATGVFLCPACDSSKSVLWPFFCSKALEFSSSLHASLRDASLSGKNCNLLFRFAPGARGFDDGRRRERAESVALPICKGYEAARHGTLVKNFSCDVLTKCSRNCANRKFILIAHVCKRHLDSSKQINKQEAPHRSHTATGTHKLRTPPDASLEQLLVNKSPCTLLIDASI